MAKKGKGTIKMFNPEKNFGFIRPEDGPDDIHFRGTVSDGTPREGLAVEYLANMGDRGLSATKVTILSGEVTGTAQTMPGVRGQLPAECVFATFYAISGTSGEKNLKPEIFFEAPKRAAALFKSANLSASALRMLFQGFRAFAGSLSEGRTSFDKAKEMFGNFYVEKVIRQNKRGMLPDEVVSLFDSHKDVILTDEAEMRGFLRYLTNILCYFGDKVK
ncbi:MAG: cold-shock protein [Desulfomonilaceae bacterium]